MSTTVQTPETPKTAARWEDFIDLFFSPAELFRRRANDGWGIPFLVLILVGIAVYYAFLPVTRAITEAAMTSRPGMTPEQMEQARGMVGIFQLLGGITVPIFVFIFTMIFAAITLVSSKIASIEMPFRRAAMIVTFIGFLTTIQQIIGYALMSFKLKAGQEIDPVKDMSFGVLRFLDTENMNAAMVGLLSRIDVFALWSFAWMVIALMAASRAPRGAAIIASAVVWLVGALPIMIQAMGN